MLCPQCNDLVVGFLSNLLAHYIFMVLFLSLKFIALDVIFHFVYLIERAAHFFPEEIDLVSQLLVFGLGLIELNLFNFNSFGG
jgi:hypothetical protein